MKTWLPLTDCTLALELELECNDVNAGRLFKLNAEEISAKASIVNWSQFNSDNTNIAQKIVLILFS